MKRLEWPLWIVAGPVAGLVGWEIGGLFGSFLPRIVGSSCFVGGTMGLLARNGLLASGAFVAAGVGSALGYLAGMKLVSPPLCAWTLAGLGIGLIRGIQASQKAAWVWTALSGWMLAGFGLGLGALAVAGAGLLLGDGSVLGEFMAGGAAGFGLCVMVGMKAIGRLVGAERAQT